MTRPENSPCAVILTVDEGDGLMAEMELVFATRWQAEWYLAQLPLLRIDAVKAAILSPLVDLPSQGLHAGH